MAERSRGRLPRWVVSAAVVIGVLLALELGMRIAEVRAGPPDTWPTAEMGAKYDQLRELAAEGRSPDVVFVGSSSVFEGLDPLVFSAEDSEGRTAYNAGLGAASMLSLERWVKDVVLPVASPETVVIGVTGRDVNDNGVGQQAFFNRLRASGAYASVSQDTAGNVAERTLRWMTDRLAILRMRQHLREPVTFVRSLVTGEPESADVEIGPYGAEPESDYQFEYVVDEEWRTFWAEQQLADYSIGGPEVAALRALVEELVERDIDVVVVNMPVTAEFISLLPSGEADQAEFVMMLRAVTDESGGTLFDAGSLVASQDLFRDPAHLNPRGARSLTRALAEFVSTPS